VAEIRHIKKGATFHYLFEPLRPAENSAKTAIGESKGTATSLNKSQCEPRQGDKRDT